MEGREEGEKKEREGEDKSELWRRHAGRKEIEGGRKRNVYRTGGKAVCIEYILISCGANVFHFHACFQNGDNGRPPPIPARRRP